MLEIKNLTKVYKGGKKAVSDLNLSVEAGDIYGFIGHNGAGKTTTIKCIVGIHDFDEGEILVDHKSVKADYCSRQHGRADAKQFFGVCIHGGDKA